MLLLNLIARKAFPYRKYYQTIQVHSPTIETDPSWQLLRTKREERRGQYELYDHLDAEAILSLVDYNNMMIKMMTSLVMKTKKKSFLITIRK